MPQRRGTSYGELLASLLGTQALGPAQTAVVRHILPRGSSTYAALVTHELMRQLVRAEHLTLRRGDPNRPGTALEVADPRRGRIYRIPDLLSSQNPAVSVPMDPAAGPPPRFQDHEIRYLFEEQSRRVLSSVEQSADVKGMIVGILDLLRTMLDVPATLCFTENLPVPAGIARGLQALQPAAPPPGEPGRVPLAFTAADQNGGPPRPGAPAGLNRWERWVSSAGRAPTQGLYLPDLALLPADRRPLPGGSAFLMPLRHADPAWSAVLAAVTPERFWFDAERRARLRMFAGHIRRQFTYAVLLQTVVSIDFLTRVHNRAFFEEQLRRTLASARRRAQGFALLLVDIDDFKLFNSRYGYDAGDRVLRSVAGILKRTLRTTDVIARYGGEEFAVLLAPPVTPQEAAMIAERLRQAAAGLQVEVPTLGGGVDTVQVTISIGGALFPEQGHDRDAIWHAANRMVLTAKEGGKNRVCLPWEGPAADTPPAHGPGESPPPAD